MRKFLFYSKSVAKPDGEIEEDDSLRTPVGVFRIGPFPGRHFAATWNHGAHENIKQGSTMNIYNENGKKFETNVLFKASYQDFLLLESDEKLAEDAPEVSFNVNRGTHYLIMGYRADDLEPSFLPGVVEHQEIDKNRHFRGTSAEMPDFSGGPAYQKLPSKRFLGLCLKGAQGYQIVPGHCIEDTFIMLVGSKKAELRERKELHEIKRTKKAKETEKIKQTEETKKAKCFIL